MLKMSHSYKTYIIDVIKLNYRLRKPWWAMRFKTDRAYEILNRVTLHDFCRATDQIGYDMKRRVIAEDRGI